MAAFATKFILGRITRSAFWTQSFQFGPALTTKFLGIRILKFAFGAFPFLIQKEAWGKAIDCFAEKTI